MIKIEVARLVLRVEMEEGDLFRAVARRYADFVSSGPPRLRMVVEHEDVGAADLAGSAGSDGAEGDDAGLPVSVQPLEAPLTYRLVRPDFDCVLDLRSGEAAVRVAASVYSFDNLLRASLALALARERAFLLHSTGLLKDGLGSPEEGRAYLFFGVSGVGKSTTARRARDCFVLSDELVAIRREEGGFRAYGTPFCGEIGRPGAAVSGPIAALLRLGRPPGPALQRIEPAEVARSLLRCALYFGGSLPDAEAVLATCLELARAVPCYHFRARLDVPVWEQLNDLE